MPSAPSASSTTSPAPPLQTALPANGTSPTPPPSSPPTSPPPSAVAVSIAPSVSPKDAASVSHSLPRLAASLEKLSTNLSTVSNLDTTLLTITYTIRLLSHLPFLSPLLRHLTDRPRNPVPRILTRLLRTFPPLSSLLSDLRVQLRLFALPSLSSSLLKSLSSPPSPPNDRTLHFLRTTQLLSLILFQGLENIAYLSDKGVIKLKKGRVGKAWLWSSRFWALWTGLELGRLVYVRRQRSAASNPVGPNPNAPTTNLLLTDNEDTADAKTNSVQSIVERDGDDDIPARSAALAASAKAFYIQAQEEWEWERKWWRDVLVNLLYAPMTLHYGIEGGILGETGLAVLGGGVVVGSWT